MKCKTCGTPLSANNLDRCPKCDPKPPEPHFTKSGKALELLYFVLINGLIILGLIFLIILFIKAWLPSFDFLKF